MAETRTPNNALIESLRSSAKAFRENTVYTADGDPHRLGVQADECDAAAVTISALSEALQRIAEMSDVEADFDGFEARGIARSALSHRLGEVNQSGRGG